MISPEIVGIIGAVIILVAWAWETTSEVKKHKVLMDLRFSFLSAAGDLILIIYSWQIGNAIFFWLNMFIAFVILFEIWYSLHIRKVYRKIR